MSVAANSPKMAPEAPATAPDGAPEQVDRHRSAERADEVDGQEPPGAEQPLQRRPDDGQREHVADQVQQADVQEGRPDQPPVLPVDGDQQRHQLQLLEQPGVDVAGDPAGRRERGDREGDQVEHAEHDRDQPRAVPRRGRPNGEVGRRMEAFPAATHCGHWKPTDAGRRQSGQIGRSHRTQETQVSRSGCR